MFHIFHIMVSQVSSGTALKPHSVEVMQLMNRLDGQFVSAWRCVHGDCFLPVFFFIIFLFSGISDFQLQPKRDIKISGVRIALLFTWVTSKQVTLTVLLCECFCEAVTFWEVDKKVLLLSTIFPSNAVKSKMLPQVACPMACWHDLMFSVAH